MCTTICRWLTLCFWHDNFIHSSQFLFSSLFLAIFYVFRIFITTKIRKTLRRIRNCYLQSQNRLFHLSFMTKYFAFTFSCYFSFTFFPFGWSIRDEVVHWQSSQYRRAHRGILFAQQKLQMPEIEEEEKKRIWHDDFSYSRVFFFLTKSHRSTHFVFSRTFHCCQRVKFDHFASPLLSWACWEARTTSANNKWQGSFSRMLYPN